MNLISRSWGDKVLFSGLSNRVEANSAWVGKDLSSPNPFNLELPQYFPSKLSRRVFSKLFQSAEIELN